MADLTEYEDKYPWLHIGNCFRELLIMALPYSFIKQEQDFFYIWSVPQYDPVSNE